MEKCHEYYDCKRSECIMFENDSKYLNCWDLDDTLCNHSHLYSLEKIGIDKCKLCLYFKSVNTN